MALMIREARQLLVDILEYIFIYHAQFSINIYVENN
jgi:hypothetical protein